MCNNLITSQHQLKWSEIKSNEMEQTVKLLQSKIIQHMKVERFKFN